MSASVQRVPGVVAADLNFASATLLVEYERGADPLAAVERVVAASGHGIQSLDREAAGEAAPTRSWLDRNLSEVATFGSGGFALLGWLAALAGAPDGLVALLYALAITSGGLLVWRRALVSLRARMLDMNVLMTIAVFGAVALGEWGEAATVYFLYALGGVLESRSLERTRRSIKDLMDLAPPVAHVRRGGSVVDLPAEEVRPGEIVVVRPGERVPVDGTITSGASAVDESPVTGESLPVDRGEGDRVFAGTLSTSGVIEIVVTATAADSTLARIVYLVEEAQATRAPSQAFVDRFSRIYTPVVIAFAMAVAVVPPVVAAVTGLPLGGWSEWIHRALVMLVVSCPCALVISTPVSLVSGIARATRDGVLVKGGAFLEQAAKVRSVAFDKTGTLTEGRPEVAEVVAFDGLERGELLALAASVEAHSNHPLARAVVRAAADACETHSVLDAVDIRETAGRGVSGRVDGIALEVASPSASHDGGWLSAEAAQAVARVEAIGCTALVVARGGVPIGVMGVADQVRPETPATMERLRALGITRLVMLTGDNQRVATAVAESAGITEFQAQLLPSDKTTAIAELKEQTGLVAMVGDGINDAPALAAADIGIAMGAAGSDTALETADVALMRDDLSALPGFFALGRRTMNTVRVNVFFSIAVKAVFLVLALTGYATLWMAVFADTGVALLVILNGMRLLGSPRRA